MYSWVFFTQILFFEFAKRHKDIKHYALLGLFPDYCKNKFGTNLFLKFILNQTSLMLSLKEKCVANTLTLTWFSRLFDKTFLIIWLVTF